MELKDVSQPKPQAPSNVTPLNEDFASVQRRYGFRQPNQRAYQAAAVVSAFWIGAFLAFILGYLGLDGLFALDWPWLTGLAFSVAFPVALVWLGAHLSRRAYGLQLASEDLLQIAARLIEPDAAATREIGRLGRAVRREIDALNTGLENALGRVRTLESAIAERLQSVGDVAKTLEERGETIRASLREEREALSAYSLSLATEADRLGELVQSRGAQLRAATKQASDDMAAAQSQLDQRATAFRAVVDAATQSAQNSAQTADRGIAALVSAAEAIDSRLDSFLQRGERQRVAIEEAVKTLKSETEALEQTLARNLDALSGLGQSLSEQTRRADAIASDITRRGEAAAGGLGARTDAIAAALASQVDRLDQSAAAAEERLKATTAAAAEAAEQVRTTFELAARSAATASTQTTELTSSAMTAVTTALESLNTKTEEARKAAADAIAELRAEADTLPAFILERMKELRAADLALPPPPPEPDSPRDDAATSEPSEPDSSRAVEPDNGTGRPEWFGFARKLAGFMRKEPDAKGTSDWRLSTALAKVDEEPLPGPAKSGVPSSVDLHKEALHVVEKLQALAIDLDRALGDDPAPDLWRRYVSGERSVFTRRLITSIGREGADKIAHRYAADTEFRIHADRYMTEFEGLLDDASARDRDQILVETFLTSQTGRLYLLVASATGRL